MKSVAHYSKLARNDRDLIRASRCLGQSKRSPQARLIQKGNKPAILKAAKEQVTSWSRKLGSDFCKKLCDLLDEIRNQRMLWPDLLAMILKMLIGYVDPPSGFVISLIWLYREKMIYKVCICKVP